MKAKTVTSKQFERVNVLLERIVSCLYEVLAEDRHISTVWAVSSLLDVVYLPGCAVFCSVVCQRGISW